MVGAEAMLMFGDSSGNPSRASGGFADSPYYIVGTATMSAPTARRVDAQVLDLKRRHLGADPMGAEMHGNVLKKALYRHTKDKTSAEMSFGAMVSGIINIAETSDFAINMVIIDKGQPIRKAGYKGVARTAWFRAADMFCQDMLRVQSETVGVAVLDRYDDATNRVVGRAVSQGLSQLDPLRHARCTAIPYPMFIDSRSSNLVQLVDMLTYVVARDEAGPEDEAFSGWRSRLSPRIDKVVRVSVG